jgi:hypothetical protein
MRYCQDQQLDPGSTSEAQNSVDDRLLASAAPKTKKFEPQMFTRPLVKTMETIVARKRVLVGSPK